MADSKKIKAVWDTMGKEERDNFISSISDEEAKKLADSLETETQAQSFSFTDTIKAIPSVLKLQASKTGETIEAGTIGFGRGITTTGQGVKQLGLETAGLFSDDMAQRAKQFKQDITEERDLFNRAVAKESPSFRGAAGVGQFAGAVAPLVPFTPLLGAPTAISSIPGILGTGARVGFSSGVGSGIGLIQPVFEGDSRAGNVRRSAATAGLLSAGLEPAAAAARPLASMFTTAREAEKSGGLLKRNPIFEQGVQTEKITGVKFTPGQVTGSQALSEMRPGVEFVNKQSKDAIRFFDSLAKRVSSSPKPSPQLAESFDRATNQAIDKLVTIRKIRGDNNFLAFRKSLPKGTGIQGKNLSSVMDDFADDAVMGTPEGAVISMRTKLATQLENGGGELTANQFLGWSKRIDKLMKGKSDLAKDLSMADQKRIGARLSDALWDDVKLTSDILGARGASSPAALLRKAHDQYRKDSAPIHEIENSALGTLFGKRKPVTGEMKLTPEKAGEKLMSLEPSEIASVYTILKKHNPKMIQEYQATKLFEAIKGSTKLTPASAGKVASESKFMPQKALESLLDKNGLRQAFSQDPKLMSEVIRGVRLLDRLSDRLSNVGQPGTRQIATDAARNIVSLNSIFIAGLGAKVLAPVGLWRLTSTEGGRNLLKTLATAPLGGPKMSAAIIELNNSYLEQKEAQ